MEKNYNYTRHKLHIPEYGRHIQEMVNSLIDIEDRADRNRQARAVIAVMGNLNPLLRDTADFTHKLWDHLFIMSDFKLDVDSPYPQPTRQELTMKPESLSYSRGRITHKHYGRYVPKIVKSLCDNDDNVAVARAVDNIARFMRVKSFEYNEEHPNNELIIKDIKMMSEGRIILDEDAINSIKSEYKSNSTAHSNKSHQRNNSQRQNPKNRKEHQSKGGGQRRYTPKVG